MMTLAIAISRLPLRNVVTVLCRFVLFGLLQNASIALAGGNGGIVVLNSNTAVKHYTLAQTAFTGNMPDIKANRILDAQTTDTVSEQIRRIDPELIYAIGSKAYLLAQEAAENRAIVFSSVLNWQRLPTNNHTYGVSNELPSGMQLMTYRYLFPAVRKIGVIYSERFNREWLREAQSNAADVGIELIGLSIIEPSNLPEALQNLLPRIDAFWLISDPITLTDRKSAETIFKLSAAHKKPVIAYSEIFASLGATLVISADVPTMGLQAAGLVRDLRTGQQPMQRVVEPAGSHIILNMRKVKEYGLPLNDEALGSVNQIIE